MISQTDYHRERFFVDYGATKMRAYSEAARQLREAGLVRPAWPERAWCHLLHGLGHTLIVAGGPLRDAGRRLETRYAS